MARSIIAGTLCSAALLSLVGCVAGEAVEEDAASADVNSEGVVSAPTPDIPTIARDVHLVEQMDLTRPYLPALRTSSDGRLGLNSKPSSGRQPNLFLMTPEAIQTSFPRSARGAAIVTSNTILDTARLRGANTESDSHLGLCDAPRPGKTNPYLCADNALEDCYDVTVIQTSFSGTKDTLWGAPITVHVANPKTPTAAISRIDYGTPVRGTTFPFDVNRLLEMSFVGDGHLFLARLAGSPLQWKDKNNVTVTTTTNIAYFAGNPSADPCDVTQFKRAAPLSHAPYDPAVNTRYGFAMQPFRDPMGQVIPDGVEFGVTYPWMDKSGDNLVFMSVNTTLFNPRVGGRSTSKYPASCATSACASQNDELGNIEDGDGTRGKTIVGLWTNGKMVLMDNLINNTDFGLHIDDAAQRLVTLYKPLTGPGGRGDGKVRVGSGRDNGGLDLVGGGSLGNITFVDSVENRYNFRKQLRPVTPRDVVWTMNSGVVSDEFAFDDHVNPDALIVSSMVQAIGMASSEDPVQHDGIDTNDVMVQNGATSPTARWKLPAAGVVTNGRIEPTATGGIEGKGLWLSGDNTFVTYTIPQQTTDIRSRAWNVGLFVDSRFADNATVRTLIQFPDGSELQMRGRRELLYFNAGGVVRTVVLPETVPSLGWAHIGLQMKNRNRRVEAYLNGYLFDTFDAAAPLFELSAGKLVVGDAPGRVAAGFRGWIDDFRVIAQEMNPEVACNLAGGTLVGITSATSPLAAQAARYPETSHRAITGLLSAGGGATSATYACYHDFARDRAANAAPIPAGAASVRDDLLFPEGPLSPDLPRPDSSANAFCLSCHTAQSKGGLGLDALVLRPRVAQANDPRRQPMQPSARVFGNIPANWLAPGVPSSRLAPTDGTSLDHLLAQ